MGGFPDTRACVPESSWRPKIHTARSRYSPSWRCLHSTEPSRGLAHGRLKTFRALSGQAPRQQLTAKAAEPKPKPGPQKDRLQPSRRKPAPSRQCETATPDTQRLGSLQGLENLPAGTCQQVRESAHGLSTARLWNPVEWFILRAVGPSLAGQRSRVTWVQQVSEPSQVTGFPREQEPIISPSLTFPGLRPPSETSPADT